MEEVKHDYHILVSALIYLNICQLLVSELREEESQQDGRQVATETSKAAHGQGIYL